MLKDVISKIFLFWEVWFDFVKGECKEDFQAPEYDVRTFEHRQ